MVSYNQEDFEQEFHLFEGDLATDGHEHIRRSTLTIIDMEGRGSLRERCLENLEANKNSLSPLILGHYLAIADLLTMTQK